METLGGHTKAHIILSYYTMGEGMDGLGSYQSVISYPLYLLSILSYCTMGGNGQLIPKYPICYTLHHLPLYLGCG